MKHFMIHYRFANGTEADWHKAIAAFIAALDSEPAVKGRIAYRVMQSKAGPEYYHLAAAEDEAAIKTLQGSEFFKRYNEQTRAVAEGATVTVTPLELVGGTAFRG